MLYRINYQNFLTYMIDYFTQKELINIQYAVVSAKVKNLSQALNVTSVVEFTPDVETIAQYVEIQDPNLLYKMYRESILKIDDEVFVIVGKKKVSVAYCQLYSTFVKPVLNHNDICIICDKDEDIYIDCLCKLINEEFNLEAVNLNTLFTKGKIGSIYLDRDAIHDKFVPINRAIAKDQWNTKAATADGREYLIINSMSKKEKLKMLDKFGITPMENDDIDKLLLEVWNEMSD